MQNDRMFNINCAALMRAGLNTGDIYRDIVLKEFDNDSCFSLSCFLYLLLSILSLSAER